jgi:hypothetical protein
MTDEHDRALDSPEDAVCVRRIRCQVPQRVRECDHRIAEPLHRRDLAVPTRRIRPTAMHKHDRRLDLRAPRGMSGRERAAGSAGDRDSHSGIDHSSRSCCRRSQRAPIMLILLQPPVHSACRHAVAAAILMRPRGPGFAARQTLQPPGPCQVVAREGEICPPPANWLLP